MFPEHQISILRISEGLCDTKDWSYDSENSALPIRGIHFLLYFQMLLFLLYFDQINEASCEHQKSYQP